MARPKAKVGLKPTYDALDDRILDMYLSQDHPSFNEIRKKIPGATHSRCVRAVWRSKREAKKMKPKLRAVQETTAESNNEQVKEPLAGLRAIVRKFVQDVSAYPEPIQDMSITISTAQGTVSVKLSQEVKVTQQ